METKKITNEEVMEVCVTEHKDFAAQCRVTNEVELHEAGEFLVRLKKLIKEVDAWFKPMIDQAYAAHKAICNKKNLYIKPLETAETTIKQKIGAFQLELDRIRDEEERKAREKAEKEAEIERQRLLKQAENAEAKGNHEKAQECLNAAADIYVAPAPVAVGIQKPNGIGVRYEFIPEVTDKNSVPEDYKIVDLSALKRVGNATKDNPPTIPGVKWIKRLVVSGRTK